MIKKCISMVAVLTCLVFLTACGSEQKTDAVQQQPAGQTEKIETGMTAPDMELVAFDGKKEKLSALYADSPVFMNFWASWCPPCVQEMPDIERAYNAYGTKIHFVSVNLDTKREDAQAFRIFQGAIKTLCLFLRHSGRKQINLRSGACFWKRQEVNGIRMSF